MTSTVVKQPLVYKQLKLGGGGYVTGHDEHTDGTLICRTDTAGAFIWSYATSSWTQFCTEASLNPADRYGGGVFAVAIAPSNSNRFFMAYGGYVYRSENKGGNWIRTNCPFQTVMANNGTYRLYGGKMAVDPANQEVVYFGSDDNGLYRSLDAGYTWTQLTDVTESGAGTGSGYPGITCILIDPVAGTTTVSGVTVSSTVWCTAYGTGPWRSTNGGVSWSNIAGGPASSCAHGAFDAAGNLFLASAFSNVLWRYSSGSFTNILSSPSFTIHNVAPDPNIAGRVICGGSSSQLKETLNSTAGTPTWGPSLIQFYAPGQTVFHNDNHFGWMDLWNVENAMSCGSMAFSKKTGVSNRILNMEGIGVWYADLSSGFTSATYEEMTVGIENLVGAPVTTTPDGSLYLSAQDRPCWKITNPDTYSAQYLYFDTITHGIDGSFDMGNSVEYLSSNNNVIGQGHYFNGGFTSTDGGATRTHCVRPSYIASPDYAGFHQVVPLSSTTFLGFFHSKNQPGRSTDGGATWTGMTFPIIDAARTNNGWGGFCDNYYTPSRPCCQDRVTAGTAYAFWGNGTTCHVFVTVDYGVTWTTQYSGALLPSSGFGQHMKSPEGFAGHLFVAVGFINGTGSNAFNPLLRSTDGGVNWTAISDTTEIFDFDFGAKLTPAQVYPTVWILGWVNGDFGTYYSTNFPVTQVASNAPATYANYIWEAVSWTKVAGGIESDSYNFPGGQIYYPRCLGADKVVPSRAYISYGGGGFGFFDGTRQARVMPRLRM